ncbi:tetratricopeptide repeat protein [Campylobacter lanienae]|uniref:tetratricopeptide repeat protein n=1 Tax=Campylobacter lanienae TaxID=75658 RepID=UPI000BB43E95|nr:tetratricopeptide repeat protein [Campylobacter lanienae]
MKKSIHLAALVAATSIFAEVSVFDAGNINKENPYGLTENEKVLLNNKKKVDRLDQNIGTMQSDVSLVQENIEGVKSLLDGINKRILAMETRITELENSVNSQKATNSNDISNLKSQIKTTQTQHDKDIKNITNALSQLTALIDSKHSEAANPKELNSGSKAKQADSEKKSDNLKYDDIPGAELLEMADKAYKSKEYLKASECFASLIKKNYKPAYSNFMLGEIEYFNKNYKTAIPYYEKSVAISQKGKYMPKLLYHTAISFDKIGDTNSANKFYKALKQAYPDSPEAAAAPDRK